MRPIVVAESQTDRAKADARTVSSRSPPRNAVVARAMSGVGIGAPQADPLQDVGLREPGRGGVAVGGDRRQLGVGFGGRGGEPRGPSKAACIVGGGVSPAAAAAAWTASRSSRARDAAFEQIADLLVLPDPERVADDPRHLPGRRPVGHVLVADLGRVAVDQEIGLVRTEDPRRPEVVIRAARAVLEQIQQAAPVRRAVVRSSAAPAPAGWNARPLVADRLPDGAEPVRPARSAIWLASFSAAAYSASSTLVGAASGLAGPQALSGMRDFVERRGEDRR